MKLFLLIIRDNFEIMQIDESTYNSYCDRRAAQPDVDYKKWAKVYGAKEVEVMETRYQKDLLQLDYLMKN